MEMAKCQPIFCRREKQAFSQNDDSVFLFHSGLGASASTSTTNSSAHHHLSIDTIHIDFTQICFISFLAEFLKIRLTFTDKWSER